MPMFAFEWNVESNHPIINQLRSNRFSSTSMLRHFSESSCRFFGFDISVDLIKIFLFKSIKNVLRINWVENHRLYVSKNFSRSFLSWTEKRFLVFRLPF